MARTLGALVVDIAGLDLTQEDKEIIAHPMVGGVILFARNYDNRAQLTALCARIRQVVTHPRLILVDQEGGRVMRFRDEFSMIPAMGTLGQLYDRNPARALKEAQKIGQLLAQELLSAGVDLSLTPVLDVNFNQSVIGDRSFHADPDVIILLASCLTQGMKEAGMASVGKHFPGHGTVLADSHLAHPVDDRSLAEIEAHDALPFRALIHLGLNAILPAHIVFPQVDTQLVSFSRIWLQDILRKKYRFSGTILSDDLTMKAATIHSEPPDRVRAARAAGCDFTLLCNDRAGVIQTIDSVPLHLMNVPTSQWHALIKVNRSQL